MEKIHFKECPPEETVKKLKSILAEMDIETEEQFIQESSIGTYSMRVLFKGSNIGTNGKGVSREYCMASAYAELFERYQNDLLEIWNNEQKEKNQYGFYRAYDEKILTTAEIISENNPFIRYYFKVRNMENADFMDKVNAFNDIQRYDYWLYQLDGKYVTIPFYSVRANKTVNMPYHTYIKYYGSNGMCAGNTSSEAIVQGLSEIFERVVSSRIFIEKPTLPDIPETYIKKFPLIDELYTKLKQNKEYEYFLKDCSFGGLYPVAALIVVHKNTGAFGIKLGSHPNYGIAMERCFTEAAQGRDIYEYSQTSILDFYNTEVDSSKNICNSHKTGRAKWPYQVFGDHPTYKFIEMPDVSNDTNEDLMRKWINNITTEGYDVLIRDVSYLGFPSYHIIIPGLSELQNADDKLFRAHNTRLFTQKLLTHPEDISTYTIKYMLATFNYFKDIILENEIKEYFKAQSIEDNYFPGQEIGCDMLYMQAMCYAYLNEYNLATEMMCYIKDQYSRIIGEIKQANYYNALYYYFMGMDIINNHNQIMQYIAIFFDKEIVQKINEVFSQKITIFTKQYPKVDDSIGLKNTFSNVIEKNRNKLFDYQIKSGITQDRLYKILN